MHHHVLPVGSESFSVPVNGIKVEIDVVRLDNGEAVRIPRKDEIEMRLTQIEQNLAEAELLIANPDPIMNGQGKAQRQVNEKLKRWAEDALKMEIEGDVVTRVFYLVLPSFGRRLEAEEAATTWNPDGTMRFSELTYQRNLLPYCVAGWTPEQFLDQAGVIYPAETMYLWEKLKQNLTFNEAMLPFISRSPKPS